MQTLPDKLKKVTSTKKGIIIILSLSVVILAAIGIAVLYWNTYKSNIIRAKLTDAILEKTQGLYVLHYDNLALDEVAGDLVISNLTISYDSVKYQAADLANDAPPILLNITVPTLSVSGVKTPRALLNKEIVGKKILINDPVINIVYTNAGKDSARNIPDKAVYEQILGKLNLIKVDSLEISGARITTSNLLTGRKNIELMNTFISLTDVAVDSASWEDDSRLLFSKQISLSCQKISWLSRNGMYNCRADSISMNTATNSGDIKKFAIDPILNEDAFVKSLATQDDRFDFVVNNIRIRQIDMQKLFNEQFMVDSLLIGSSSFKIYRDLSIKRDNKNRVGSYPHQVIEQIPIPVLVKKMIVTNAFVEYKEKNPRTNMSGKVRFHQVYATISNLSNDREAIKTNNIMTADIKARFLDKAPLAVVWTFYLRHPRGKFNVRGNLGSMDFQDASLITEPMGPAKLEDGHLNKLQFNFTGSDYGTHGKVTMLYDDLKISVLEKDKGSKELDKKTLATIAANFIIKNSNPGGKKEDPRVIDVQMQRDTNRSIFYLIWKSLFKGIKETAGIKK